MDNSVKPSFSDQMVFHTRRHHTKKLVHHKVLFDIAAALPTDVESLAAMKSVPARSLTALVDLIPGYLEAANSAKAAVGEALPVPYERYESLFLKHGCIAPG